MGWVFAHFEKQPSLVNISLGWGKGRLTRHGHAYERLPQCKTTKPDTRYVLLSRNICSIDRCQCCILNCWKPINIHWGLWMPLSQLLLHSSEAWGLVGWPAKCQDYRKHWGKCHVWTPCTSLAGICPVLLLKQVWQLFKIFSPFLLFLCVYVLEATSEFTINANACRTVRKWFTFILFRKQLQSIFFKWFCIFAKSDSLMFAKGVSKQFLELCYRDSIPPTPITEYDYTNVASSLHHHNPFWYSSFPYFYSGCFGWDYAAGPRSQLATEGPLRQLLPNHLRSYWPKAVLQLRTQDKTGSQRPPRLHCPQSH